jgi:hypothetical protein
LVDARRLAMPAQTPAFLMPARASVANRRQSLKSGRFVKLIDIRSGAGFLEQAHQAVKAPVPDDCDDVDGVADTADRVARNQDEVRQRSGHHPAELRAVSEGITRVRPGGL